MQCDCSRRSVAGAIWRYRWHEFRSGLARARRTLPWLVLFFVLFETFVLVGVAGGVGTELDRLTGTLDSADSALVIAKLLLLVAVLDGVAILLAVASLFVWGFLSMFSYWLLGLAFDELYWLVADDSRQQLLRNQRYNRVLYPVLNRLLNRLLAPAVAILIVVLLLLRIGEKSYAEVVDIFRWSLVPFVLLIFGAVWVSLYRIRSRCQSASLDAYLFSKTSVRSNLKSMILALVFLAVLGWVLLPGLFLGFLRIESWEADLLLRQLQYERHWEAAVEAGYEQDPDEHASALGMLPDPRQLRGGVRWLEVIPDRDGRHVLLEQLMHALFFILTLAAACSAVFPALVGAALLESRRKAALRALRATLKSTALLAVIQLLVSRAYFVDVSAAAGMWSLFLFGVSFFFAQEAQTMRGRNVSAIGARP